MSDVITTLHPESDPNTNLFPNVKEENIPPEVIGGKLLWENANPTSAFPESTVTILNRSAYKFLVITFKGYMGQLGGQARKFVSFQSEGYYMNLSHVGDDCQKYARRASSSSYTQVTFSDCKTESGATNNELLIPIAIYGTNTL